MTENCPYRLKTEKIKSYKNKQKQKQKKMETKIRLTLYYFLKLFEKKLLEEKVETISTLFTILFSKEELFQILSSMYNQKIPQGLLKEDFDSRDILEAISDHRFILTYTLELWKKELESQDEFSPRKVKKTLEKFSLENHYLAQKPTSSWDKFDKNNYRLLLSQKGVKPSCYGIFDVNVKEQDKYTCTTPALAFPSLWEAQVMMAITMEIEGFRQGELKIMAV